MVVFANTIIYPRAVVVHVAHATLTRAAMMRTIRFVPFTGKASCHIFAVTELWVSLVNNFELLHVAFKCDSPRVSEHGLQVSPNRHSDQRIEDQEAQNL